MHETAPEITAAAITAAATIYVAELARDTGKSVASDDEIAKRVAEIAAKILAHFIG